MTQMTEDNGAKAEPVTIGDLRESGKRLGLRCQLCSRFRYLGDRRFDESAVITRIAETLRCARCGSPDVETFSVSRSSINGYWPAESS